MIRLTIPDLDDDEFAAVLAVLKSGFLVQGPKVAAFEKAVARLVGTKHAIAVSNCTAALHLSLLVLGVKAGDLVATTAYSWPATANAIELCGAEPVFVDICADTYNMDPEQLETTLKSRFAKPDATRRVKAILPVHAFGQMADVPTIMEIASRYDLPVVEDAACALGAVFDDRAAGSCGVMGCFSFHPRKAITTGEGGMITTNDDELARRLRALRNHGLDSTATGGDFVEAGFNYRMTDLQGALGCSQMSKLETVIASRRRLAAQYDDLLADTCIQPPRIQRGSKPVYQSYVVSLPDHGARARDGVIARMRTSGVETTIGTWHIPLTSYYASRYGYGPGDFPISERVFSNSLTLPLHTRLTHADEQVIVDHLIANLH